MERRKDRGENRHRRTLDRAEGECSSDLDSPPRRNCWQRVCKPADIDYLLFCTQSPDYFLPTTACVLQQRLGVRRPPGHWTSPGVLGYVYGLGLAKALIETGQARNVLLVTAETYSKFIHPQDKSVRTLLRCRCGDLGTCRARGS